HGHVDVVEMPSRDVFGVISTAATVVTPLPGPLSPDLAVPDDVLHAPLIAVFDEPICDCITIALLIPGGLFAELSDGDVARLSLGMIRTGILCVGIPAIHAIAGLHRAQLLDDRCGAWRHARLLVLLLWGRTRCRFGQAMSRRDYVSEV